MNKIDKISRKLINSLRSRGIQLDDPGVTNSIIFAIAEAYGLGEEEGILIGKKRGIERFDGAKERLLREIELDEHLFNEKVNNYK